MFQPEESIFDFKINDNNIAQSDNAYQNKMFPFDRDNNIFRKENFRKNNIYVVGKNKCFIS